MPDKIHQPSLLPQIRVLQVEDNPLDAELMLAELQADGIDCEVRLVEDESLYVRTLKSFEPHIVLSDLGMPGFSGQRALELLRDHNETIPFIYVSGTLSETAAIAALRDGVTDYIFKHSPARLASAVRRALREADAQKLRVRMEAELIRSQRFKALAVLASGLSHNLRNVLQPLLLAGESLLDYDYDRDPRLARIGLLVRECGRHSMDMVQAMLTLARGTRCVEQVKVQSLLEALSLLLTGSLPHTVTLETGATDPLLSFEGHRADIQQSLLNLCFNAIQAMPHGGILRVAANAVQLDAGFFLPHEKTRPGDYVCLQVSDTGTGMDENVRQQMFEAFFTTKRNGTGLGLHSCQYAVEQHSGVMRIDSVTGRGSCFELYLPRVWTPKTPAQDKWVERNEGHALHGGAGQALAITEQRGT